MLLQKVVVIKLNLIITTLYSSDVKIILDDDDDVIMVPTEELSITEIPDDDEDPVIAEEKEVIIDDDTSSTKDNVIQETVDEPIAPTKDDETEKIVDTAETNETTTEAPTPTVTKPSSLLESSELNATYEPIGNESDIQILVPQIAVLDVDDFEEKPDSGVIDDETSRTSVKIKEEPKDDGYDYEEDDGFEEVGTFESDVILDSPVIGKFFNFHIILK